MPKYFITVSAVNVKNKQDLHFHTNLQCLYFLSLNDTIPAMFSDLDTSAEKLPQFKTDLIIIEGLPFNLPLEIIKLQCNDILKGKYQKITDNSINVFCISFLLLLQEIMTNLLCYKPFTTFMLPFTATNKLRLKMAQFIPFLYGGQKWEISFTGLRSRCQQGWSVLGANPFPCLSQLLKLLASLGSWLHHSSLCFYHPSASF